MTGAEPDPYTVLGVSRAATAAEITRAYRAQLRAHHPDTRRGGPAPTGSQPGEDLSRIIAAYTILHDPDRRCAYDRAHPQPRRRTTGYPGTRHRPPLQAGPVHWWGT